MPETAWLTLINTPSMPLLSVSLTVPEKVPPAAGRATVVVKVAMAITPTFLGIFIFTLWIGGVVQAPDPGTAVASAFAHEVARKSAGALANIKRLVRGSTSRPLSEGRADERTLFCDLMVSEEAIALMSDFNAGRRDIRDDPSKG